MGKFIKLMTVAFMAVIVLAACGGGDDTSTDAESKEEDSTSGETLKVVTTFTLLEDIVKQIGGDTVETFNLVPIGTDPHEYEPLPEDMGETEDADVLFFNGLNLEGGDSGWFSKLISATDQDEDNVYEVADGVDPMYLGEDSDEEKEVNPHSFLDPQVGMIMAENVKDALIEISPENKEKTQKNTMKH